MSNDDQLEREIRAWAERPPARSPQAARTRVLARLDDKRAWPGWRFAAAAAMVIVALASGLLLYQPATSPDPTATTVAQQETPGLLVYELRSGTKLYLALTNRQSEQGDNG